MLLCNAKYYALRMVIILLMHHVQCYVLCIKKDDHFPSVQSHVKFFKEGDHFTSVQCCVKFFKVLQLNPQMWSWGWGL